jgi:hypothetical protein
MGMIGFRRPKFYGLRLKHKCSHFHFGPSRANAFFGIDLFIDGCGTVRAFEKNQIKR